MTPNQLADLDEPFVCYLCKCGDHAYCVGVPCMCDCPDPKLAGFEKCCFNGCQTSGKPQDGFDFFACAPCLDRLEILTNAMHRSQKEKS